MGGIFNRYFRYRTSSPVGKRDGESKSRFRLQVARGLLRHYLEIFTRGCVLADRESAQTIMPPATGPHATAEPSLSFLFLIT